MSDVPDRRNDKDGQAKRLSYGIGFGLMAGTVIGLLIWLLSDQLAWFGIGPAIGMCLGFAFAVAGKR